MTKIATLASVLALAAAADLASADGPLTREQVKAELAEAQRSGDIVAGGEAGLKLNELFPGRYPAKPALHGSTRSQVQAELAEAQRTGNLIAGEAGERLHELYPHRYPPKPVVAARTRAEVKAELAEAIRTGDIIANGESGLKLNELSPGLYPMPARGREAPTRAAAAQTRAAPTP